MSILMLDSSFSAGEREVVCNSRRSESVVAGLVDHTMGGVEAEETG